MHVGNIVVHKTLAGTACLPNRIFRLDYLIALRGQLTAWRDKSMHAEHAP
jgi:hypothetical protein